ncbi:MAG: MotA/TolQ/ExbB proton channel family protein [Planctomycetaceae bacterium]|nr:MotA/TolQ/ExbB proton channel family protein [Planctomycetaceae bacterium]
MWNLLTQTGVMGVILVLMAIAGVALLIERLIVFHHESTNMKLFSDQFAEAIKAKDDRRALEICNSYKGHGPEVYQLAVQHKSKGPASLRNILNNHIDLTILPRLKVRLRALNSIAKSAPMVGLLGTVYGMMGAFATIAGAEGKGVDAKDLAGNIGLALGTTFLGLLVAIPIVFAVAYLRARIDQFEIDLELYTDYCLDLLYPSKPATVVAPSPGPPRP